MALGRRLRTWRRKPASTSCLILENRFALPVPAPYVATLTCHSVWLTRLAFAKLLLTVFASSLRSPCFVRVVRRCGSSSSISRLSRGCEGAPDCGSLGLACRRWARMCVALTGNCSWVFDWLPRTEIGVFLILAEVLPLPVHFRVGVFPTF